MIKILYTTAFADAVGGGQISLLLLLKHLDRNRFKPILLVPGEGEVAVRARQLGCDVRIFACPPLRSGWRILPAVLQLRRILKESAIALIHTDEPRSTLYSIFARMGLKIPVIWHIRTMIHDRLDFILERGADRLILVAQVLGERFSDIGHRKSVVIYNGIDPKDVPKVDDSSLPSRGTPLLICPARVQEDKGQHILLEALNSLKREFPTITLWIVGRAEEDYLLELKRQISENKLEESARFLGHREDLRGLLPLADLVVLPTFHEAFPRVLLEAMSAGRAVVASRVGGVPEAVQDGETGSLVPPGDSEKLAAAIGRLLRDREIRERMGELGRRRVSQFSVEKMVGSVERLYGELVS